MHDREVETAAESARNRRILAGVAVLLLILAGALGAGFALSDRTAVSVTPEAAGENFEIAVVDGTAIALGGTVFSLSAPPIIAVRSHGFGETVVLLRMDELGGTVAVALTPLPGRLLVSTTLGVDGVLWSLNDDPVATGVQLDLEREAGTYELEASHPYYQDVRQRVDLSRGALTEVTLQLVPVQGRLVIETEPAGAEVRSGSAVLGTSPLDIAVDGGRYDIRIETPDRQPLEDVLEVTSALPDVTKRYELKPFGATVSVVAMPEGGELLIDGELVTPGETYEIAAHEDHAVTYELDGYYTRNEPVNLARGEHRSLFIQLLEAFGTVDIQTTPGAEIVIDGEVAGISEARLQLTATTHTLELRRPGYRTVHRTITPKADGTLIIREDLVTERAARLAEASRVYTNPVGMKLALFEPGLFEMGAPRSEEGQRANEFQKTVRLTKPFYAALHEVTNGQFAAFSGESNGPADLPATGMSWTQAASFANWLSEKEELTPFYRISGGNYQGVDARSDGYRLLTEAEWEWLARSAGKRTESIYPWGDSGALPARAGNIADVSAEGIVRTVIAGYNDGFARLAPVGSFPAEASGLFDLTGNVSEWVHDFYSLVPPNQGALFVDPLGPRAGLMHTVKGSSWRTGIRARIRPAFRQGLLDQRDDVGFRLGRYLHGTTPVTAGGEAAPAE